jgi:hypothetical protein
MAGKRDQKSDIPASSVDWLTKLAAEINVPLAPEGWYTMEQICEKTQRDHQSIRRILKKMNVEVRQFRYVLKNGRTTVGPHYYCSL